MACPTCDHTMQRVNEGVNPKVFWCPRCGTLSSEPYVPPYDTPKLVKYALELANVVDIDQLETDFINADELTLAIRTVREAAKKTGN